MPNVTESYGKSIDFIAFFGYFHTLLMTIHVSINCCIPTRLSQIVCLSNFDILTY